MNNDNVKIENNNPAKNASKIISIFLIVIAIAAAACVVVFVDFSGGEKSIVEDVEVKESAYRMSGNSIENFDLYFLQLNNSAENKVYSPLSIKYALQMLAEGTNGVSEAQLKAVIGDYKANKYVNSANMSFANALFIKEAYKDSIEESYKKTLSSKYNAEVVYDSFASGANLNSWVSDRTFKLITNLFDDDVSKFDFILVNALAIDMEWNKTIQAIPGKASDIYSVSYAHEKYGDHIEPLDSTYPPTVKFNNETTEVKALEIGASINRYDIVKEVGEDNIRKTVGDGYKEFLANGGCGMGDDPDVDTFLNKYIEDINSNYGKYEASTDFLFHVDDDVKMFAKNLKEYDGTVLQYVGIMPTKESLADFVKDTDAKKINILISNLKEVKPENFKDGVITELEGNIPVFNFEYDLDLMESLKELGITDVFDINKADLSGIVSGGDAVIGDVAHKANIEFSNEGIKAAAATMVGGMGSATCGYEYLYEVPVEKIDLTFNNPYMFLIRDVQSGEVWFAGTVYNPTTK